MKVYVVVRKTIYGDEQRILAVFQEFNDAIDFEMSEREDESFDASYELIEIQKWGVQ